MVPVGGVAGLYLQLTPKGGRSWILRMLVGGRRWDTPIKTNLSQFCFSIHVADVSNDEGNFKIEEDTRIFSLTPIETVTLARCQRLKAA